MSNPLLSNVIGLIHSAASALWIAGVLLFYSAFWMCGLALLVKGKEAVTAARKAAREIPLNLSIVALDTLFVAPFVGLLVTLVRAGIDHLPFAVLDGKLWDVVGRGGTLFAVVF